MRIIFHNEWRIRAIFGAIIIMLVSLFVSRAFLTINMILFMAVTTIHKNILSQFAFFFKSPLLIAISFLFFIPFISGLWSSNWQTWLDISIIKLPFFLLPLAFGGNWQLREKQWGAIAGCFLALVFVSCCWSIWQYFQNMEVINESYLKAKTLPTPLSDDHVRFSWLVVIAVLCSGLLFYIAKSRNARLLLAALIIFFVVYLHVLSARTGLVSVYFFFLCFAIYMAVQRKKTVFILIPAVMAVVVASWWSFPTLKNRIKYVVYDFSFLKNESLTPGTSDANRLVSLKAGWYILQQNPFGVGAGDIRDETEKWYETNLPSIEERDKLFPSNEWLVYGDMAGWPAVLLFTIIIFFPLFIKQIRHRFFWFMLVAISIGCCLIETSLEIQFGIFIYCFTILWWWKWLKTEK